MANRRPQNGTPVSPWPWPPPGRPGRKPCGGSGSRCWRWSAKGDGSPVTAADRAAESIMREAIAAQFPDDAILGEEFGDKPGTTQYRWVLDPIDGTKSFICRRAAVHHAGRGDGGRSAADRRDLRPRDRRNGVRRRRGRRPGTSRPTARRFRPASPKPSGSPTRRSSPPRRRRSPRRVARTAARRCTSNCRTPAG